jgi:hypothetical protein
MHGLFAIIPVRFMIQETLIRARFPVHKIVAARDRLSKRLVIEAVFDLTCAIPFHAGQLLKPRRVML